VQDQRAEDLTLLGLDAADRRGVVAGAPGWFIVQAHELAQLGEAAFIKMAIQHAFPRDIVAAAAGRYHILDLLFDCNSQPEMRARYVLPLSLARYPRE
jgi:hypothetical protein